jgi:hypothetical protein
MDSHACMCSPHLASWYLWCQRFFVGRMNKIHFFKTQKRQFVHRREASCWCRLLPFISTNLLVAGLLFPSKTRLKSPGLSLYMYVNLKGGQYTCFPKRETRKSCDFYTFCLHVGCAAFNFQKYAPTRTYTSSIG